MEGGDIDLFEGFHLANREQQPIADLREAESARQSYPRKLRPDLGAQACVERRLARRRRGAPGEHLHQDRTDW